MNYAYFCFLEECLSHLEYSLSCFEHSFKECGDHMKTYRNFCEPKLSFFFYTLGGTPNKAEMSCGVPETDQRDFKGNH